MTQNKINIAELLKDCPKGMELYSTIFGPVYFEGVRDTGNAVLIDVKTVCNTECQFYPDGKFNTYYSDSEMTLFPSKDVRTWEGFVPPCEFKDGDILVGKSGYPFIFKSLNNSNGCCSYCGIDVFKNFKLDSNDWTFADSLRFASEGEKERLFDAIKANGYKWNAETKTLEELIEPKFKVGDKIANDGYVVEITEIDSEDEVYVYESKVGGIGCILFSEQDDWALVPNKFDINSLKPFDKVLVRDNDEQLWSADLFGFYRKSPGLFMCVGHYTKRCVPYEGNEHLLGTTDNCDEFYKTW